MVPTGQFEDLETASAAAAAEAMGGKSSKEAKDGKDKVSQGVCLVLRSLARFSL